MRYLSVDPGKKSCGIAVFTDGKVDCVDCLEFSSLHELLGQLPPSFDAVVSEIPQVYQVGKSKGDPNDLIQVALCAGAVLTLSSKALAVQPREWKGTIDGDLLLTRIRSNAEEKALRAFKQLPAKLEHNAVDAYGLGRWFWGRYGGKL